MRHLLFGLTVICQDVVLSIPDRFSIITADFLVASSDFASGSMTHLISAQVLKSPTVELTLSPKSVRPFQVFEMSEMSHEVTHSFQRLSSEHPPPPRATRLGRVAENPYFSAGSNRQSWIGLT